MWRHSDRSLQSEGGDEETPAEEFPGRKCLPTTVLSELPPFSGMAVKMRVGGL